MNSKNPQATFAAGCFWHVEEAFRVLDGVICTEVGYMGGSMANPTYDQVCSDTTGHAEVVHILYDPHLISYEQLVAHFFKIHDPTQLNKQGPDIGTPYRSAIFYYTHEQKESAEHIKELVQKRIKKPIVTQIVPAETFWKAQDDHQKYLMKRARKTCGV